MVEFAGWEMPLRYEAGDKSKVAGSPGKRAFSQNREVYVQS